MRTFIFGSSPSGRELHRKIGQIARTPVPILIEGETGTGKETLAQWIHATAEPVAAFARFAVTSQEQLLSEIDRKSGEGTWGRVISTSSQPLDFLVAQNRFHAPLYHRLAGARIALPPLREHAGDIP